MKHLILSVAILTLYSCQSPTSENGGKGNVKKATKIQDETVDVFCDTTKIKDFTTNLTIVNTELTDKEKEYQDKQAKSFIAQICEQDTLFCGGSMVKQSKVYEYDKEWKFLLTGYVIPQETGIEEDSASFFVLTILKNNEPWFTDVLEDLMGEIQGELNGFENKDKQVTVWGQVYPYFTPDYGKFRLKIKNEEGKYEFQCHSQH